MEYQKIINLFDNIANQLSQFWTKNWAKINDSFEKFNINSQIKFKNSQTWQAQMQPQIMVIKSNTEKLCPIYLLHKRNKQDTSI